MEIKIYQTNNRDYRFMNYDFAIRNGLKMSDYNLVANFMESEEIDNITEYLEHIYYIGNNGDLTSKFVMRSISVSDIVEIGNRRFYCDIFGWKEVN